MESCWTETRERAVTLLDIMRPYLPPQDEEYLEIEIEDDEYDSAIDHGIHACRHGVGILLVCLNSMKTPSLHVLPVYYFKTGVGSFFCY